MRWKRLFYYLLINVLVTACTMFGVLYAWERYRLQDLAAPPVEASVPTAAALFTVPAGDSTPGSPDLPTPEFQTYTVQQGDSLLAIANQFGVTVEEIVAVNDLSDPDVLEVGMLLNIPRPAPSTAEPQAAEVEGPPQTPLPPPVLDATSPPEDFGDAVLQIVTVVGAGDLAEERVVVQQSGEAQVSLQGWQLVAQSGETYVFPQLVLFKDGAVTVYTKAGANSVTELYWGLAAALWASGDVISLIDPQGDIVAAYQVP